MIPGTGASRHLCWEVTVFSTNGFDFLPGVLSPETRMPAVCWVLTDAVLDTLASPALTRIGLSLCPCQVHCCYFLPNRHNT